MSSYVDHIYTELKGHVRRQGDNRAKASRRKFIRRLARYRMFALTGKWVQPRMDERFREIV